MTDKEPIIRRLHGRAIERAFQTGEDVISCFHHGEESFYVERKRPKEEKPTTGGEDERDRQEA